MGLARIHQRASAAPLVGGRQGHLGLIEEPPCFFDQILCFLSYLFRNLVGDAIFGCDVVDHCFTDGGLEHLFETERLGGGLDEAMFFFAYFARFVFDRAVSLRGSGSGFDFDDVGFADQAVLFGPNVERSENFLALFGARLDFVHPLVELGSTEGKRVFIPDLLDVDERTLPGTV